MRREEGGGVVDGVEMKRKKGKKRKKSCVDVTEEFSFLGEGGGEFFRSNPGQDARETLAQLFLRPDPFGQR